MAPAVGNSINTVERLEQRLACNRTAPGSFRRFVERLLQVRADDSVLDLGCGLGEQLIPAVEMAARAVGVDVSGEMLEALRKRLPRANAELVQGDMDALAELGLRGPFSLAYSVYSIYYSRDPARLVRDVAARLAGPRARFVVVAPDLLNNHAWYADLGTLFALPEAVLDSVRVCRDTVLPALLDAFPDVRCASFRSDVEFASVDELMRYYDACAPYCRPERRAEAGAFFGRKLAETGSYTISKRALGLVGRLRRSRKRASRASRSASSFA
jgi:SAM-dependent methyltransferase